MDAEGLSLRGRVALVTGGSRGIGRATILRLAELGADVVVNYLRDEQAAAETVREAEGFEVKALAVQANVGSLGEAEHLVRRTLEEFGRLDILVCNAGIWEGAPVEEISEELWDRVIEINLKGTWTICRAAVPAMKNLNGGRIVIVSSTAGQRGEANVSNYAASKGGQISFTKSLATELAAHGINVNCVAPGWVDTEMNTEVFADRGYREAIERTIPLGRVATADDVARPIVFLCTEWARHITGEILNINGGSVLCG
ncbi:MAG TPA: 3-oxoacyl-ACP reductase family protein [Pyrinomonadaceae bacterium]|nr:3-oxoacyl-ACP reductase family protein [Pyrinomonadaceae bacterium]